MWDGVAVGVVIDVGVVISIGIDDCDEEGVGQECSNSRLWLELM